MASQEPISAAQLTVARTTAWHLTGEPILTLEAANEWLTTYGLVLFAPRALQLGAPAPSLVEATLGTANEAPSLAQTETARSLAARMVAAGDAVPLNLLGGPGDVPDFLASAQVFSFLYTLRGDKLWKQAPATTGANKVTPLALSVYELLGKSGALTAAQIADELGRELTENAVARAVLELWQHMRVIPLLQQGEGATQWELTSKRFTKAIKAGTNAGQPTALSALVSLYLAQSLLASEEEVAGFLSPVAARSRIREVLHALVGARELSELVIDGKTLLHIPGALPEFPEIEVPVVESAEGEEGAQPAEGEATSEDGSPIKRFTPSTAERERSAYRGKPAPSEGFRKDSRERGPRPARPARPAAPATDRERRPFNRSADAAGSSDRPARPARPARSEFARPWDEDRKPRRTEGAGEGDARPPRRPRSDDGEARPARSFGSRPAAGKSFRPRTEGGDRPYKPRTASGDRPYKPRAEGDRPYKPRTESSARPYKPRTEGDRPYKPRTEGDRPYRPRTEGGDRPYKPRTQSGDRSYTPRTGGDRPFKPRAEGDRPYKPRTESGDRPYRARPEGDRPYKPRTEGDRPYRPRTEGGDRPYKPRTEGARPYKPRTESGEGRPPFRPRAAGSSFGDRKPYTRRPAGDGEDSPRPRRTFSGDREGSSRPRPSGDRPSFGDRKGPPRAGGKSFGKPAGKSFGAGRPASKFAGKKPFGKGPAKGPGRGPASGGDRPVRRPRSEE